MRAWHYTIAWMLVVLCSVPPAPAFSLAGQSERYQQRVKYLKAVDDLRAGRRSAFKRSQIELADYPLAPYLTYHDMRRRLDGLGEKEILGFTETHPDIPVIAILKRSWLKRLGARRQWQTLLAHIDPEENNGTALTCYYLRALYGTGEKASALAQVADIWIDAKSLPKTCDPLFDVWVTTNYLTDDIVWRRLTLALQANEVTLARYLQRFFSDELRPLAIAYYRAHVTPQSIAREKLLASDSPRVREVFKHGLARMIAKEKTTQAQRLWRKRQQQLGYDAADRQTIDELVIHGHAAAGTFPADDITGNPGLASKLAMLAVRNANWPQAVRWIEQLDAPTLEDNQWRYWFARALQEVDPASKRALAIYHSLAREREYYGFMAAERLGVEPAMNERNHTNITARTHVLQTRADVARTLELYAVGDHLNARREWNRLMQTLSQPDREASAHLASRIGWLNQAIRAANSAKLHDVLELRFPVAYEDYFRRSSHVTSTPVSFLMALARQESAFDPRARSSANARGLMQMLPSTARLAAKRANLPAPNTADLYQPATNIELASHHIARLSDRYHGSRPLIAAAYNAGEHRVDRWISERSGTPMDIWVENIPFKETRNYVKNVTAFSHVYGRKLGDPLPVMQANELRVP